MILKPITSEKAVKLIDIDNTLVFEAPLSSDKKEIKTQIEKIFKVKIETIRTNIRNNKKFAYVKLVKANPAIDVATKLGLV